MRDRDREIAQWFYTGSVTLDLRPVPSTPWEIFHYPPSLRVLDKPYNSATPHKPLDTSPKLWIFHTTLKIPHFKKPLEMPHSKFTRDASPLNTRGIPHPQIYKMIKVFLCLTLSQSRYTKWRAKWLTLTKSKYTNWSTNLIKQCVSRRL